MRELCIQKTSCGHVQEGGQFPVEQAAMACRSQYGRGRKCDQGRGKFPAPFWRPSASGQHRGLALAGPFVPYPLITRHAVSTLVSAHAPPFGCGVAGDDQDCGRCRSGSRQEPVQNSMHTLPGFFLLRRTPLSMKAETRCVGHLEPSRGCLWPHGGAATAGVGAWSEVHTPTDAYGHGTP